MFMAVSVPALGGFGPGQPGELATAAFSSHFCREFLLAKFSLTGVFALSISSSLQCKQS
jgi:hypothetical protein